MPAPRGGGQGGPESTSVHEWPRSTRTRRASDSRPVLSEGIWTRRPAPIKGIRVLATPPSDFRERKLANFARTPGYVQASPEVHGRRRGWLSNHPSLVLLLQYNRNPKEQVTTSSPGPRWSACCAGATAMPHGEHSRANALA